MLSIIAAENKLDALLPRRRLEQSPPPELLSAARAWSDAVWDKAMEMGPAALSDEDIAQGQNLANSPVFICGVHRSGTTLVRNLLDGHPELVVLPSEGTYYTNLEFKLQALPESGRKAFFGKEWLRRLANPINQPPYWLLGRSSDSSSPYVDFARYFMAWWEVLRQKKTTQWPHTAMVLAYAMCTGNITAKLWVDKTPVNERFLQRIWHEMPGAKIIHVVRDPVNTLASRKKMEPGITMRNALRDLKLSYKAAIKHSGNPRFMLLRYEELCDAPEIITGRIAAFLGVEPSPLLYQATVAGIPAEANSSYKSDTAAGQIIKPQKHQQAGILSKEENQLLIAYVGSMAGKLNYIAGKIGILQKCYLQLKHRLF